MNYAEFKPSKSLSQLVKCFWTLDQPKTAIPVTPEPVMPDGCIELVFNLADPFRRHHRDGTVETQPLTIIAGQMRTNALIQPSGKVHLFGIRFKPAGAYPFFKFPLHELTDQIVDLHLAWGAAGRDLEGRMNDASSTAERIALVEGALLRLFVPDQSRDELVEAAASLIAYHAGALPIERLAREVNVSSRRLERRFRQRHGLSPKSFSRIVRFQNLLNLARQNNGRELLEHALALGYYDQAHLIHEFKTFSGKTPVEFFAQEHRLSDVFIAA
jgi:AraC-like DNA-binding protein